MPPTPDAGGEHDLLDLFDDAVRRHDRFRVRRLDRTGDVETELLAYATEGLVAVPGLKIVGNAAHKASVLSFVMDGIEPTAIGTALNQEGIAVRAGHHCAQPILRRFGLEATVPRRGGCSIRCEILVPPRSFYCRREVLWRLIFRQLVPIVLELLPERRQRPALRALMALGASLPGLLRIGRRCVGSTRREQEYRSRDRHGGRRAAGENVIARQVNIHLRSFRERPAVRPARDGDARTERHAFHPAAAPSQD
jgi:hypothetical protein